ncbi:MAG: hypothetical protein NVS9B2_27940 [Steroidobacteraceae bacterium]
MASAVQASETTAIDGAASQGFFTGQSVTFGKLAGDGFSARGIALQVAIGVLVALLVPYVVKLSKGR